MGILLESHYSEWGSSTNTGTIRELVRKTEGQVTSQASGIKVCANWTPGDSCACESVKDTPQSPMGHTQNGAGHPHWPRFSLQRSVCNTISIKLLLLVLVSMDSIICNKKSDCIIIEAFLGAFSCDTSGSTFVKQQGVKDHLSNMGPDFRWKSSFILLNLLLIKAKGALHQQV